MTGKQWSNIFAARVRSILEYMNMMRTELCEKLKIEHKKYDRWMSGEYTPKATDIVNIAKVLQCSVSWLIDYRERIED